MGRYLIDTNVLVQIVTEQDFTENVHYILNYSGAQIIVSSECVKEFKFPKYRKIGLDFIPNF